MHFPVSQNPKSLKRSPISNIRVLLIAVVNGCRASESNYYSCRMINSTTNVGDSITSWKASAAYCEILPFWFHKWLGCYCAWISTGHVPGSQKLYVGTDCNLMLVYTVCWLEERLERSSWHLTLHMLLNKVCFFIPRMTGQIVLKVGALLAVKDWLNG